MNTTDSHDTTYGRALAYAADAIRRGDNSTAITLLTPYTDAAHDPVTYDSAYRLLYPLAPNDTLRDRLIAAVIQGANNSYTITRHTRPGDTTSRQHPAAGAPGIQPPRLPLRAQPHPPLRHTPPQSPAHRR